MQTLHIVLDIDIVNHIYIYIFFEEKKTHTNLSIFQKRFDPPQI
jgi:hypothetical protein